MAKYARAMQRYALNQQPDEEETPSESLQQVPKPAVQQQSISLDVEKDGQDPQNVTETSWLFQLTPTLQEGYLQLNRNILLITGNREPKTILFTSCEEGHERAFVTAEFAAVLANEVGRRVLLVDGDLYQSFLSRLFGRSEHCGLQEALLSGNGTQGSSLDPRCPGLVFLPSGVRLKDPFHPSLFQEWVRGVKESFDYILIDTPPLSQGIDSALLGKHADGVIIVAQAERTDRTALIATKEQLEKSQCQLLGVILTHTREYVPRFLKRYVGFGK